MFATVNPGAGFGNLFGLLTDVYEQKSCTVAKAGWYPSLPAQTLDAAKCRVFVEFCTMFQRLFVAMSVNHQFQAWNSVNISAQSRQGDTPATGLNVVNAQERLPIVQSKRL
jgi:hypothetical protein